MPVSPELGERLAARILAIYLDAERIMLEKVAARIKRGIDEPGWAEAKLADIRAAKREARVELARLERRLPADVRTVVDEAYEAGVIEAEKDAAKMRLPGAEFARSDPLRVRRLIGELMTNLRATHVRILRFADDVYRSVIAETSAQVLTGTVTRRETAQLALNAFADRGITGFVDAAGRAWDMASYAEMATRSATGRAAVGGHLDRLQSMGHDLVIVSDVPQECELCREYEGQTLSISGRDGRYQSVDDATAGGLFHPGCRHDLGAFFPGFTPGFAKTADPIGAAARTEQRYLERGLRKWKRRSAVGDTTAPPKVAEWRERLTTHIEANDLKRLRARESIGTAR